LTKKEEERNLTESGVPDSLIKFTLEKDLTDVNGATQVGKSFAFLSSSSYPLHFKADSKMIF
jgi:hypothetical protein